MFNLYIVLLKLNIFTQLIFVNPADPHSRAAHDLINSQVRLYIPTKSICSRTARRKNLAPRFYEDRVCDTRSASRALEIAVIKKPVRARARVTTRAARKSRNYRDRDFALRARVRGAWKSPEEVARARRKRFCAAAKQERPRFSTSCSGVEVEVVRSRLRKVLIKNSREFRFIERLVISSIIKGKAVCNCAAGQVAAESNGLPENVDKSRVI